MKIKICGLFRPRDAEFVNAAAPDYIGFVFVPNSRRYVTDIQAQALRGVVRKDIRAVGVFADEPPEHILSLCGKGCIQAVQLHGSEDEEYISALRALIPGVPVWKAFIIRSASHFEAAAKCSADKILLDGGSGSGRGFERSLVPPVLGEKYILAGGLTPSTIPEAASLRPYAVDLSSGVESGGVKDGQKILDAVYAARGI